MIKLKDGQITDILPLAHKKKTEVKALSEALQKENERFLENINKTMVYASIDELPEKILDVLAAELGTQYYEADMEIEVKREMVKNSLYIYSKAGTPAAVEQMISSVFGSGKLVEWFEFGGEPGTFKIETDAQSTPDAFKKFEKIIKRVKNARSHLLSVTFDSAIRANIKASCGMVQVTKITIK